MDRTEQVFINGKQYTLNYGMAVNWAVEEKYGTAANAMQACMAPGKEGFDAMRWIAVKMANNGELLRRQQGYDSETMLAEKDIQPTMAPGEYVPLSNAIASCIQKGYAQEREDPDQEYDLGLAELNEKK